MSKATRIFILFICGLLLGCSTQRMICPAYQSAFIYDKPSQKENVGFYNANKNQAREVLASNSKTLTLPANDSTWQNSVVLPGPALPKEFKRKKARYLLLPERTYKKALRALQTVQMKPVYPKKEIDSLDIKKALDSAARSITDTLTVSAVSATTKAEEKDSTYMISTEKEKFNVEQDYYMWYLRKMLVLPDVRIALEGSKGEEEKASEKTEKKGGFFKNLFKRKEKKTDEPQADTTNVASDDDGEIIDPPTDSTAQVAAPPKEIKKRKERSGFFKRKSKPTAPPKGEPKKEDEDKF